MNKPQDCYNCQHFLAQGRYNCGRELPWVGDHPTQAHCRYGILSGDEAEVFCTDFLAAVKPEIIKQLSLF